MSERPALTHEQRQTLRVELSRPDLSVFTCVQLAREELAVGHFDAALACLAVDADKIRTVSLPLYNLIQVQYEQPVAASWLASVQKFQTSTNIEEPGDVVTDAVKVGAALDVIAEALEEEDKLARLRETAKTAWADVPSASKWVDELRGDVDDASR